MNRNTLLIVAALLVSFYFAAAVTPDPVSAQGEDLPAFDDMLDYNADDCVAESIHVSLTNYWSGGEYNGTTYFVSVANPGPIVVTLRRQFKAKSFSITYSTSNLVGANFNVGFDSGTVSIQGANTTSVHAKNYVVAPFETDSITLYPPLNGGTPVLGVRQIDVLGCITEPDLDSSTCVWEQYSANNEGWSGGTFTGSSYALVNNQQSTPLLLTFPEEKVFNILELTWAGNSQRVTKFRFSDDEERLWLSNSTGGFGGSFPQKEREYRFQPTIETTFIEFHHADLTPSGANKYALAIFQVRICISAQTFNLPYIQPDEDDFFGMYSTRNYDPEVPEGIPDNINFGVGNKESIPIYAITNGNVVDIDMLTAQDCSAYFFGTSTFICPHNPPDNLYNGGNFLVSNVNLILASGNYVPIYRVRVQDFSGFTMTYLITNPLTKIGGAIVEGCRIGDSIKLILGPTETKSIVALGYSANWIGTTPENEAFEAIAFEDYVTPGLDCNIETTAQYPLEQGDEYLAQYDGWSPPYYSQYEFCLSIIGIGIASNCNNGNGDTLKRFFVDAIPEISFSFAEEIYQPVYSIAAGEVLSKREISIDDCQFYTTGGSYTNTDQGCVIEVPSYANPEGEDVFHNSVAYPVIEPDTEIWHIQVLTEENELINYFVTDPMVDTGDLIDENCMIGRTMPVYLDVSIARETLEVALTVLGALIPENIVGLLFPIPQDFQGKSVVMIGIEPYQPSLYANDVYPQIGEHDFGRVFFVDYPVPSLACNVEGEYADCLTINPKFNNSGEFWETTNPAKPPIWLNPGVILEPGGGIRLPAITLDPATEYGASTVASTGLAFDGELTVFIGQSTFVLNVQPSPTAETIPAQLMTPSTGVLYDIVVTNTGDYDVEIQYFCLVEGDPDLYPDGCVFLNNSFDLGLLYWNASTNITHEYVPPAGLPPWDLGRIKIDLAGGGYEELSQPITPPLAVNEDGSPFTYSAFMLYEAYPGGGSIEMDFTTPEGIMNSYTLNPAQNRLEFTFDVEEATAGPYYFGFYTGGLPAQPVLYISKICITPPYPDGGGGGGETPEPTACDARPQFPGYDSDVEEILVWQWANFDHYHQCELLPRIDDIYKLMNKMYNFMGDSTQFWMYTMYRFTSWLGSDLLPWLAGYLSNIAPGTVTINNQQCSGLDLICLISQLIGAITETLNNLLGLIPQIISQIVVPILDFIIWVLGQAATLLFGVLTALISLVLMFLTELLRLLSLGVNVLVSLANSWNNAPALAIEGLPSCSGGGEPEGLCLVWWIMENTILGGVGAAIIPAIVSFGWIMLGLWVVYELKQLIQQIGSST